MNKITQNFYQAKTKGMIHRFLCASALLLMTTQMSWGQTVVTWTPSTAFAAPSWDETVGTGTNQFSVYDIKGKNSGTAGNFIWSGSSVRINNGGFTTSGIALFVPATSGTITKIEVFMTGNTRKIYYTSSATLPTTAPSATFTLAPATASYEPWGATLANDTYYSLGGYTGGSGNPIITKIEVTFGDPTADPLATDSFKADSSANVYANGNQVFVANVKSNTTVAVYSVSGALVKTVETSGDTSFDLASGVYVAKVKSAEGEKSVKLLVK